MSEIENLTEVFRKLGAKDPEGWASSQAKEGINQLGRFVFLKQAWSLVLDEIDLSWIHSEIQASKHGPDQPYAGIGRALSELTRLGVHPETIIDLVRGVQAELLFSLCYLLNCPDDLPDGVPNINWRLVQVDDDGNVVAGIDALHESVLELDPTGREMRPRTE